MWMLLVLFGVTLVVVLVILFGVAPKDEQKFKDRLKEQNILSETILMHLGGNPYLKANDRILFQIKNNNTIHFYKENVNTGMEIPLSNLTNYQVKTETEIRKDVTLTRLFALGILAFGVKKKTKIEDQYLILTYMQNKVEVNCIFKRCYDNQQLGDIISTINRLKIEDSKTKEDNIKECAID